jgi:hypothetical protein
MGGYRVQALATYLRWYYGVLVSLCRCRWEIRRLGGSRTPPRTHDTILLPLKSEAEEGKKSGGFNAWPGRAERRRLMPEGARAPGPVYEDGLADAD